jgi:flagellum-specific peptidoglycan hydrolase FlgJ
MPPINPHQIEPRNLPEAVYDCFNQLIVDNLRDRCRAVVLQKDVVALLKQKGYAESVIYAERLLDIETQYRAVGWDVEYSKPGFNETGEAYYVFTISEPSGEV